MNPRGNPHTLAQARRRTSFDKRQRALTALAALERQGEKITHAAVARTAGVSTWLTYTDCIREHIEAAQQRRQPTIPPARGYPEHHSNAAHRTRTRQAGDPDPEGRQGPDAAGHPAPARTATRRP